MRKEQLHYYSFNTKTAMLLLVDTPVEDADMRAATASLSYTEPLAGRVFFLGKREGADVCLRSEGSLISAEAMRCAAVYYAAQRGCRQRDEAGRSYRDVSVAFEGFETVTCVRAFSESLTEFDACVLEDGAEAKGELKAVFCSRSGDGAESCRMERLEPDRHMLDDKFHELACKAAIKAGTHNTLAELQALAYPLQGLGDA